MDYILIPAYEPDRKLIELVRELSSHDLSVLVVDDGSGAAFSNIFEEVKMYANVITKDRNGGKGGALKTGMRFLWDDAPNCDNFITCDADGQHCVKDILRVRESLRSGNDFVLSVRKPAKGVPFRSKIGNTLSRTVYAFLTNRYLSDNQSGLRGFSRNHIPWMIDVEKNNYDYEMNILYYAAKKGVRISTIPIETIYINDNESSHFNPIKDTVRIYKSLFYLARSSFYAFILAEALLVIACLLFPHYSLYLIPVIGIICGFFKSIFDKYIVIRTLHWSDIFRSILRSFCFYILISAISVVCCYFFHFIPVWVLMNAGF